MHGDGEFAPAHRLLAQLREGARSSAELLDAALARAAQVGPWLGAVTVATDAVAARAAAERADRRRASAAPAGPLHGLPVTVKDCFEVAGMVTANGASALRDYRPTRTATAVQRMLDAGAIVFARSNVPEHSLDLQTFNDVYGLTRNPWDPARTPGGSSGGAAVALATGVTALEIGTDLAGSLRLPAHAVGVCALKPSFGIIPTDGALMGRPGVLRRHDLLTAGPMARNVADLGLLIDVIAGPAGPMAEGWHLQLPPPRGEARTLRVAVWADDPACPVDPEVGDVLDAACRMLEREGITLDRGARPDLLAAESFADFLRLMYGEMSAGFPETLFRAFQIAARREVTGEWTALSLMPESVAQSHRDWLLACERRAAGQARWAEFFASHDILLAPVAPTTALPHDRRPFEERRVRIGGRECAYMQQAFWCALATLGDLPAAVVPAGLARDGLPVGLQIIGPCLGERTVLEFAAFVEQVLGGFRPPPDDRWRSR